MALKITMKPGDFIYLGTSKVTVLSTESIRLAVEGTLPVLREPDYVEIGDNPTVARRLYILLQEIYMANDFHTRQREYDRAAGALMSSDPRYQFAVDAIGNWLAQGQWYKALKAARQLLDA